MNLTAEMNPPWTDPSTETVILRNFVTDKPIMVFDARPYERPPSLQAMVAHLGGYDKISGEAWAGFFEAVNEWKARLRAIPGKGAAKRSNSGHPLPEANSPE